MFKNEMILINGDILTLSKKKERAKSLVLKNGKIHEIDPPLLQDIRVEMPVYKGKITYSSSGL